MMSMIIFRLNISLYFMMMVVMFFMVLMIMLMKVHCLFQNYIDSSSVYAVNRQILFPRKALFQSNKIKMLLKQPALFSGRLF